MKPGEKEFRETYSKVRKEINIAFEEMYHTRNCNAFEKAYAECMRHVTMGFVSVSVLYGLPKNIQLAVLFNILTQLSKTIMSMPDIDYDKLDSEGGRNFDETSPENG